MSLPPLLSLEEVQSRLQWIFPEGTPHRDYCVRDMAARTVFVMLYIGAVAESGRYLAPKHVYRMSDDQSESFSDATRLDYAERILKPGSVSSGQTWYADNTREPIRDETIRQGLIPVGAVLERSLPKTSPRPRYYLASSFAALLDPRTTGNELSKRIQEWQEENLTPEALARIDLIRSGAFPKPDDYLVTFPNGETQRLTPGESSIITKQVIERFAPKFLEQPHVIWVSESGNKVVARHDIQAKKLGLNLDSGRLLPDIILVDLASMTIVFVEVVSTDGPIDTQRRENLLDLVRAGGHSESKVAFVTAFMSRGAALRKVIGDLAWNSFGWIASEPEGLISLEKREGTAGLWLHERLGDSN